MAFWFLAASAAVSMISQSSQNSSQKSWNKYNTAMNYGNNMNNLHAQAGIAKMNAAAQMAGAQMQAEITMAQAEKNAHIVMMTTEYNDALYEQELGLMWEGAELDIKNLETQRARERGTMEAAQSVSGTVMGEGSNADAIVEQKTQESMDTFVLRHGADIQASKINNARAQSRWQGTTEALSILYDGEMGAFLTKNNAAISAAAGLAQANISYQAGAQSAANEYVSGMSGANMQYSQNQTKIGGDFLQGMFGAASQGISSSYGKSTVTGNVPNVSSQTSGASLGGQSNVYNRYKAQTANVFGNSLTQAGSSVLGGN